MTDGERQQEKGRQAQLRLGGILAPMLSFLGNETAGIATGALLKLDEQLDTSGLAQLADEIKKKRGLESVKVWHYPESPVRGASFSPLKSEVRLHGRKVPAGMLAHELGHAQNQRGVPKALEAMKKSEGLAKAFHTLSAYRIVPRKMAFTLSPVASSIGMVTGSEDGATAGALAGLALGTPQLIEEGMASARALRDLKAVRGWKSSLRAAPAMASAFGTYLAPVAIPAGLGLYLAKRKIDPVPSAAHTLQKEGQVMSVSSTLPHVFVGFEKKASVSTSTYRGTIALLKHEAGKATNALKHTAEDVATKAKDVAEKAPHSIDFKEVHKQWASVPNWKRRMTAGS